MLEVDARFPPKASILFQPARYKVLRGGRGSGKSHSIARALLIQGMQRPLRILCAREVQLSIRHSVHRLLSDLIQTLNLTEFYTIKQDSIVGCNGTEFAFTGLSTLTVDTIKSYEGYDICWVEEGQVISKRSWDILLPTIRKDNSEIWISYNPDLETDETHQRFTVHQPENCINVEMNWRDNPWFNDVLEAERQYCLKNRPLDYENIWEGKPRGAVEGAFYTRQIQQAEAEGRITNVPVDTLPVYTAWDLGFSDATAIWFYQIVGQEIHFVDYYENSGEDLEHYALVLQDKHYLYGEHFAPHDARARRLSAPSIEERARELGIDLVILERDLNILAGIEVVRSMFHRFWFDVGRCEQGIRALRSYRKEWNERKQCFNSRPLHDWSCFPAGTMIDTEGGKRPIEKIKPGDVVLTPTGKKRVLSSGVRKYTNKLREIKISDGKSLTCTPEHEIFSEFGIDRADALRYGTSVIINSYWRRKLWKILLSTMDTNLGFKEVITRGLVPRLSIRPFGSITMGLFRKVIGYITRIMIPQTMKFQTLNCSPNGSMRSCIEKDQNGWEAKRMLSSWLRREKRFRNGIRVKRAGLFTKLWGCIHGNIIDRRSLRPVNFVVKNTELTGRQDQNSVRQPAKPSITGLKTVKQGIALFAVISLSAINVIRPKRVVRNAVISLPCRIAVYDLEIEHDHCYYANGILVSNSHGADAMRYAARAIKEHSPGRVISPDQIEMMYDSYAMPVRF